MDQQRLGKLIAEGMGQAATRLGGSYTVTRPVAALSPFAVEPIGTIMAIFDPNVALTVTSTDDRKGNLGNLIGDFSLLAPGDYLVGTDTWFVSHIEPLRAPVCVRCNQTISICVPDESFTTGLTSYGGRLPSTDKIVAAGWPANVQLKSHLEAPATRLPADAKTMLSEILLPRVPGIMISHGHMLTTEFGQTYVIAAAELSDTGWRLEAGLETT